MRDLLELKNKNANCKDQACKHKSGLQRVAVESIQAA
jgi:hypothetical protein